jgi:hypothetical protein
MMGLGIFKNGRHQPITPVAGSWADDERRRKAEARPLPPYTGPWPLGTRALPPSPVRVPDLTLTPSKHRKSTP